MKKQILNSLTTAFFLSLVIFMSCGGGSGGDDEPTISERELQFDRLAKTWTVSSAQADGNPIEGWDALTITFGGTATSGSFSTNGQQPDGTTRVWPTSGTWNFVSETDLNTITRSDGIEITLGVDNAGTTATLNFEIPTDGGRQDVVEGRWRFELTSN